MWSVLKRHLHSLTTSGDVRVDHTFFANPTFADFQKMNRPFRILRAAARVLEAQARVVQTYPLEITPSDLR